MWMIPHLIFISRCGEWTIVDVLQWEDYGSLQSTATDGGWDHYLRQCNHFQGHAVSRINQYKAINAHS